MNSRSSFMRARLVQAKPYLLLVPLILLIVCGVVLPMAIFVLYGFWQKEGFDIVREFTLRNFVLLFERPLYLRLIGKAILYGGIVSLATLVLAYPLAWLTARKIPASAKGLVLLAVLVPLYTSDIVRIFAWRSVLGTSGLINELLINAGIIAQPISALLFSPFAALVSLTHLLFPFMFLAIWVVLETQKPSLVEAARDLGAAPFGIFRRVVFPLSLPGVLAGAFFVFVPVTGDYLYVNLMGGTGGVTITKAIVQQFGAADNWPLGSAMATTTMLAMLVVIVILGAGASRLQAIRNYNNG